MFKKYNIWVEYSRGSYMHKIKKFIDNGKVKVEGEYIIFDAKRVTANEYSTIAKALFDKYYCIPAFTAEKMFGKHMVAFTKR